MNLLEETKRALQEFKHNISDIIWIGGNDYRIKIDEFIKLADVEYDNGYGGQEVAKDLVVVGEDWFLERHEYDGAEWWEYKTIPQMPKAVKTVNGLTGGSWSTLAEINEGNYDMRGGEQE